MRIYLRFLNKALGSRVERFPKEDYLKRQMQGMVDSLMGLKWQMSDMQRHLQTQEREEG